MHKLWRGPALLSTAALLPMPAAICTSSALCRSAPARPRVSATAAVPRLSSPRLLVSASSVAVLRDGWSRTFRPISALRNRERGAGNSENEARSAGEEGPEDGDGVVGLAADKERKSRAALQRVADGSETDRRQRGGGVDISGERSMQSVELLAIPGVGPRNLRKLVDKGFREVTQLKELYRDKFVGKSSEKMVEYLQSSVGIIHKNHAESITTFIRGIVEDELKQESGEPNMKLMQKKRLTFCVEGNISVGKTTFLQRIANETVELRDLVEIVPEPISKWQNVGPDNFNILDAFYAEPERYAYTFQNYVFVTRVLQERESCDGIKPLRLMERSVFTDRMVFVRAVHEAKWMNEMEISIYDSWFDPVVSCLPGLVPDGFIYLRASPDTCYKRMMLRKRSEEGGVSLEYLHGLHEKHESWLFPTERHNHDVLSVRTLPIHMDNSLHPDIRERVFFLEGEHMHPSIQKVPALVLDCEPNIDFNKDVEAKRQYARQVAKFFDFVKKKKEASSAETINDEKSINQQLLLPHKSSLWIPKGGKFPESLNFKRAMSILTG